MENKIKRGLDDYLSECSGVDNVPCHFRHAKLMNAIEMYHVNSQMTYYDCLLRVNDCKRIGYSSIFNSFTYLPGCFTQEKKCMDDYSKRLDFVKSCFDKLK